VVGRTSNSRTGTAGSIAAGLAAQQQVAQRASTGALQGPFTDCTAWGYGHFFITCFKTILKNELNTLIYNSW